MYNTIFGVSLVVYGALHYAVEMRSRSVADTKQDSKAATKETDSTVVSKSSKKGSKKGSKKPATTVTSPAKVSSATSTESTNDAAFKSFQLNYLAVYLLAMLSDWMQGPYTYALYSSYGVNPGVIAQLFVVGFGSSMIFGTFIGSLSDKYGRRTMCILFALLYIISAISKSFVYLPSLFFGRVCSGIATSLLYSAFESWMVCEHTKRGFSQAQLNDTFSKCTTYNGIIAVLSGLLASYLADTYGVLAPFIFIIAPLSMLIIIVSTTWGENYGDSTLDIAMTFKAAITAMKADKRVIFLGAAQALFEGAMFSFVFLWSPTLSNASPKGASLPFGIIFATYMVCTMIGSKLFGLSLSIGLVPSSLPYYIHAIAFISKLIVVLFMTDSIMVVYLSFLLFEVACGLFWPTFGTLRSITIPEANRSAISNFFRVPLNAFVVTLLLNSDSMSHRATFGVCAAAHLLSLVLFGVFTTLSKKNKTT